jgi:hypothetical protein
MPFRLRNIIALRLTLILITGCAELNVAPVEPEPTPIASLAVKSEIDTFLEFGASMAKMTPAARDETCAGLVKSQKNGNAASDVLLRLLMGRLLSDSCGDSRKLLDAVGKLNLADEQLNRLILIESEALKRSLSVTKKSSAERKGKSSSSNTEAKANKDSKDNETKLLREKLEAIRSLEKRLDDSSE